MLHTTFATAHKAHACAGGYRNMAKALGGIDKYGKNTPIPLSRVLEVCGLQDAIWCLRCTLEPAEDILIEFACRCAEHVLHIYNAQYPDDKRPAQAIAAARHCVADKSPAARAAAGAAWDAAWAAWDAAWAAWAAGDAAWAARAAARAAAGAAWDAAGDAGAAWAARAAAGDAAWAAAGGAEGKWQCETLRELLSQP